MQSAHEKGEKNKEMNLSEESERLGSRSSHRNASALLGWMPSVPASIHLHKYIHIKAGLDKSNHTSSAQKQFVVALQAMRGS